MGVSEMKIRVLKNTKTKKSKCKVLFERESFKLPVELLRYLDLENKVNYIEFYISEDYPDAFVLKPLFEYVEPNVCFVCDTDVSEFKTYRGKKICLECKSIIDGSKVYRINRLSKRYTKAKTPKQKVASENFTYVKDLVDWCIMCGSRKEIEILFKGKNVCGDCKKYLIKHSKNRIVKIIKMAV